MPKKKKEFTNISLHMDRSVHERLEAFAESHGMTKTKAIEILVTEGMDRRAEREGLQDER